MYQPQGKLIFRQLGTSFADFWRNNSVFMKKKIAHLKNIIFEVSIQIFSGKKQRISPVFNKITYLSKIKSSFKKSINSEKSSYFDNQSRFSSFISEITAYLCKLKKNNNKKMCIQKYQSRGKFIFRQLVANFTNFRWNSSAFMKKQKNRSFKKYHFQGKIVSTFSGTKQQKFC